MNRQPPLRISRSSLTRRHFLGVGAAAGALALAACGLGSTSGAVQTVNAVLAPRPVTLRLGERSGTEAQALDARLPYFTERFPHIKISREPIAGNMIETLTTMAAGGSLPDNLHCYTGDQSYQNFAAEGVLLGVDDRLARDKVALDQWFPELVTVMRVQQRLYGLPFKGQVLGAGFYFNVGLFQQHGVPLPTNHWTLDDLVSAATRLTVRRSGETVQWGYAVGTWGGENFNAHLRQWGGDSFSADGKSAALNTPEALAGLHWYEHLFTRKGVMHPLEGAASAFEAGQVAMIGRTYLAYKSTLLANVGGGFVWDGVLMPGHPQSGRRGGMVAGDAHAIAGHTKAPDDAFELLKFVTDKEFGVALGLQSAGSTTLGGRPDVYADPRILNHPQFTKQMQRAQLNSMHLMDEPYRAPWNLRAPEVYAVRDPATTLITTGAAAAERGYLDELNRQMQAILELPPP